MMGRSASLTRAASPALLARRVVVVYHPRDACAAGTTRATSEKLKRVLRRPGSRDITGVGVKQGKERGDGGDASGGGR